MCRKIEKCCGISDEITLYVPHLVIQTYNTTKILRIIAAYELSSLYSVLSEVYGFHHFLRAFSGFCPSSLFLPDFECCVCTNREIWRSFSFILGVFITLSGCYSPPLQNQGVEEDKIFNYLEKVQGVRFVFCFFLKGK